MFTYSYHICLVIKPWVGIINCTHDRVANKVYKQNTPLKQPANYLLGLCKLA